MNNDEETEFDNLLYLSLSSSPELLRQCRRIIVAVADGDIDEDLIEQAQDFCAAAGV